MFLDAALYFDNDVQILTTGASADYVDLGQNRNIGVGEDLYFVSIVSVAFTDASSNSTMTLTIEGDDSAGFGSAVTLQTIGTFAALSAIGTRLAAKLQPDVYTKRYIRVKYTVANGDLSTGKFKSFIVKDLQAFTAYADGITITG